MNEQAIQIAIGDIRVDGDLTVPVRVTGVVLFAHGSGSSRHSSRNRYVALMLQARGFATLLLDLLTKQEEAIDERTAQFRFDVGMLADRLVAAIDWLAEEPATASLPVGLFGASTGGAAALVAAARRPERVRAVVSRGGWPDLAGSELANVASPTLLIVGSFDAEVLRLNHEAMAKMRTDVCLELVRGATHLFEEPGALEHVARLAGGWFENCFRRRPDFSRPIAE
ncbi:MAG: alpha/beta fold hydrolase [Acidobacteria bacterium]|nr:MAG: alpha/beta fold hydrolase [Acidobacteriota bacterium]